MKGHFTSITWTYIAVAVLAIPAAAMSQGISGLYEDPGSFQQLIDPYAAPAVGAEEVPGAVTPEILLHFRGKAVVDLIYDTGLVGSGVLFRPSTVILDGTPEARGRGQFRASGSTSKVLFGLEANNVVGAPQGLAEFDFAGGPGDVEFGVGDSRLLRAFGTVSVGPTSELLGGKDWTTFADAGALPFSAVTDGTPAGAVFRRQALLRYTRLHDNGLSHAIAIEDPTETDFVLPNPGAPNGPDRDIRLRRWPDLVARLRWVRPGDRAEIDRAQLAALVRGIGFEDVTGEEHFVTGWGIAGSTRFRLWGDSNLQLGFVGGEGLGRYVYGFGADSSVRDVTAAGPNEAGQLIPLRTIGAYVGYQQYWSSRLVSNVAYGYAHVDPTAAMGGDVAQRTQNAWANLVLEVRKNFFVALEYQYGELRVNDGREGENHRIQMTFALESPKKSG